jgi:hypothetical protein
MRRDDGGYDQDAGIRSCYAVPVMASEEVATKYAMTVSAMAHMSETIADKLLNEVMSK